MKTSVSARILKVMGIFSGVQAVGIMCSVVRSKLISLWIGPVGVGMFAIFNSVIDMVGTATQLNMRQSAVRDISASTRSRVPFVAGVVRWWARHLGILGAVLMAVLSPVLSIVSFGDTGYWWAFALLSVAVMANALSGGEQALMQGTQRLRRLARATMTGAVAGTVLSLPLYYFFGLGSIVPSLLVFALCSVAAYSYYCDVPSSRNTRRENIDTGRGFLKLGFYLTVSAVVTTVASYAFISYLNLSCGEDTVGVYQAGYTLVIRYTGIVFTALSMEFFPRVTAIARNPRMASTVVSHEMLLILYVLTPLVVLFVLCGPLMLRLLYSAAFLAAVPFITVGIGATVFRALSFSMAYVIVARGDGRMYVVTEVSSAVIGLTLNITLMRLWGFTGLGVSYVLWYMIYTAMVWAVYRLRYGMRIRAVTVRVALLSMAIVTSAILLRYLSL